MKQLNQLAEKIDALSLRERAIVFIGIVFVLFTVWDLFFISPLEVEHKQIIAQFSEKNAERLILVNRFQELMKTNKDDPNANNLAQLKTLRSKLIDIQAELETSTGDLVSPNEMPKILETVLHKIGGLTLQNLKSLGVTPIVAKEETEPEVDSVIEDGDEKLTAENIDNAYKHGLRIEITGDYLTTLSYLKSLEALNWSFYWDNFKLTVGDYPDANVAIEIFTLSLNKEWIGV